MKIKKNIVFGAIGISMILIFAFIFMLTSQNQSFQTVKIDKSNALWNLSLYEQTRKYQVWRADKFLKSFETLEEAQYYALMMNDTYILDRETQDRIEVNIPPYKVYSGTHFVCYADTFKQAVDEAKLHKNPQVHMSSTDEKIWGLYTGKGIQLEVEYISQFPELVLGCEVTSLSMLMNYMGYKVTKLELAQNIEYDNTPYRVENGRRYYGDPSKGFLGSMFGSVKMSYGANHEPIYRLLYKYAQDKALDVTGLEFEELYYFLEQGIPIWVITNTTLKKLEENEFYTWETPEGNIITATNKEHSVLITGYDKEYIYINDPLNKNSHKSEKKDFIEAWEQMGKQAVILLGNKN